jgi:RHS repeat-associated protein
VLSAGGTDYVYGVTRIAQQGPGGREYFLGDAINSAQQLVNDAGQIGLGRAYEPFGDVLSIAGEIQTAYGFAGEWADATRLINLRARYYEPTTGRFVQPDPFEGFPTRPISLNAYPYAYDNPLMYTDASGRNPVLALAAGIALGIVGGAAAGGAFGALTYEWALSGECGCDMQQRAKSMSLWDWIGTYALSGGILGGAAVAISALVGAIGPGALIAVSGLGLVVSVSDFVATVDIILNETGLTTCTAIRLLIDVAGIVLSTVGIVEGVRAWRASGSLLEWAPVAPPLTGRAALDDLYARSRPGRRWDVREVPGEDPQEWFQRIAIDIIPHHDPALAAQGALEGTIPGGGRIQFRPITSTNPAIDTIDVPGYPTNWKYHFPPGP